MSDFRGRTETTDAKPRPDYPIACLEQHSMEATPVIPRGSNKCKEVQGKHVRQYTLGGKFITEYKTTAAAGRKLGITDTSIAKAARGDSLTSGGYMWKYIEEGK